MSRVQLRVASTRNLLADRSLPIVTLKNEKCQNIVLIGTHHTSKASVSLVLQTIQDVKPDTVMIELDQKRIGMLLDKTNLSENLSFVLPTVNGRSKVLSLRQIQIPGRSLLRRILEKLGFRVGGEFRAAIDAARQVGAQVLLGDQDAERTKSRLVIASTALKMSR